MKPEKTGGGTGRGRPKISFIWLKEAEKEKIGKETVTVLFSLIF